MTTADILKKIPAELKADAELIIAHVTNVSREFVLSHPEMHIHLLHYIRINQLLKKRKNGIPLAHLTGHKAFYGFDFLVNKHTLVPRPDTEVLVDTVLEHMQKTTAVQQILIDVGTGSGCIPISITKTLERKNIQTVATDISKKALKAAQKNAAHHNVDITYMYGNLLDPILKQKHIFSVPCDVFLTANLPYLTEEQFQTEPSIQHEPKSALVADDSGLALYDELLGQMRALLTNSQIQTLTGFFEIDPSQSADLSKRITTAFPKAHIDIKKDLAGQDRTVVFSSTP